MKYPKIPDPMMVRVAQVVFIGILLYYCWSYVAGILMIAGAYYLWKEWDGKNGK